MRKRTLMMCLTAIMAVVLSCAVVAAPKGAEKANSDAEFDQQKVLMEMWTAPNNTVVGTVNGVEITKGELLKTMWLQMAPSQLDDIMTRKMVEQAAQKSNVALSESEIQASIQDALQNSNMGSVDQLLNQYKITWYRFMASIKMSSLARKVVNQSVSVSDAEYAEWAKARHILVRFPQDETDEAKRDEIAKKKIDDIYAKAKAGEDFAKLADEYSEDPGNGMGDQKNGGDLGWFSHGRMVPEFEEAAFGMKPGEFSEPVKTNYGYHIIKLDVLGKTAAGNDKAELRQMILDRKMPTQMQQWFQNLQATTKKDNKLMAPVAEQPVAKKAPAKPAAKPVNIKASDKPNMPPPPPPPAP